MPALSVWAEQLRRMGRDRWELRYLKCPSLTVDPPHPAGWFSFPPLEVGLRRVGLPLHGLAQREKGSGGGLDSLLLEMMAMDSEKHARLLHFVQRRFETRARVSKH